MLLLLLLTPMLLRFQVPAVTRVTVWLAPVITINSSLEPLISG